MVDPDLSIYYQAAVLSALKPWFENKKKIWYHLEEEFITFPYNFYCEYTKVNAHINKLIICSFNPFRQSGINFKRN